MTQGVAALQAPIGIAHGYGRGRWVKAIRWVVPGSACLGPVLAASALELIREGRGIRAKAAPLQSWAALFAMNDFAKVLSKLDVNCVSSR